MNQKRSTVDTLAENLDYLMKLHGYSEVEVGKRSGVASKTVNNMRRGRTKASIENTDKVARVFGLNGWQLIIPGYPQDAIQGTGLSRLVDNYAASDKDSRAAIERVAQREAEYSVSKKTS